MGIVEELDAEEDKSSMGLQENYNSLLAEFGEYARVVKAAVKKMKKAEEGHRSLLVRYKEAKYEIKTLNGELTEAYSKIKFLELEVVQANAKVDENIAGLEENYNTLLEKSGEYVRVAKAALKKMKKVEDDYRSLLVRYKEAKCEIETLNGELTEAYTKVKFLKREVVQANAKVDRVSTKELDEVISS